jgi:hypothetical protein
VTKCLKARIEESLHKQQIIRVRMTTASHFLGTVVPTQRLGKIPLLHKQLIVCTTTEPFNKVSPIQFAKDCLKGMAD